MDMQNNINMRTLKNDTTPLPPPRAQIAKPTLGVAPKHIAQEQTDLARCAELADAIYNRLVQGEYSIPIDWVNEYNELLPKVKHLISWYLTHD